MKDRPLFAVVIDILGDDDTHEIRPCVYVVRSPDRGIDGTEPEELLNGLEDCTIDEAFAFARGCVDAFAEGVAKSPERV